jgi:hypothetical protein
VNKNTLRQILVVLSVLAVIVVNGLASALPLNGQTTGEISDRFEVFFVPAGYVFSIWGLIYLGLMAYAVYQALPVQADNPALKNIAGLFVLSCVANIAWIFLWHYEYFPWTGVTMLALLGLLITIYLRLDIGRAQVSSAMKWAVHVPFSIYLGWITVATIANITSLLYFWEWSAWGIDPEVWALVMLAAAVLIGGMVILSRGDVAYAAVLIWAFVGIALKHEETPLVAISAWVAAAVTAILMLIAYYRYRQQRRQPALVA